ncbi:MAG: MFS transporter [Pseudomonadota bacterium]
MKERPEPAKAWQIASILAACAVLSLAGTDLVLPAVPYLPDSLGGTVSSAQYVLAAFTAGTALGLLLFGEIGSRMDNGAMLAFATIGFALLSLFGGLAPNLNVLIAVRFLQGLFAACAAVVAPGMIRALFDERTALRAIGILGSVESLAPAIAPIIGAVLFRSFGWTSSFWTTAACATILSLAVVRMRPLLPKVQRPESKTSYGTLLANATFQRYALSHGLGLAALLSFVFAMPSVFVQALSSGITDFIVMQLLGISAFIVAANLAGFAASRFGAERMILFGSLLMTAAAFFLTLVSLGGAVRSWSIWRLFVPLNFGFGLRGPPGFYRALQASGGDDTRASALIILFVMIFTAAATAALAPFLVLGAAPPSLMSLGLSLVSLALLLFLPSWVEN